MITWLLYSFIFCIGLPEFNPEWCVSILDEAVQEEPTRLIRHKGWAEDSYVQDIVEYAYLLWGIDFVIVLECENWRYALDWVWDNGHSHWLCMVNDRWHTLPDWFDDSWVIQVEYCYNLYTHHTKFYWPNRLIHWVRCRDYVLNRFEIYDNKDY